MAVNVYDCLLILDSNKYSRDQAGLANQIKQMVESNGGEMLVSRVWEERRLAYPIKGCRKGTYWLAYFKMESGRVARLERDYQLNEAILRSLVLKVDPRIADALVEHARGTAAPRQAEPRSDAKGADSRGEPREGRSSERRPSEAVAAAEGGK